MKKTALFALCGLAILLQTSSGLVHDGRSYAIEAALPELDKEENPFILRHSWWQGELAPGERNIIRHQLFNRNEYWFWAGCSDESAEISVHVYDSTGKLAEAESWQEGHVAAALVRPEKTDSYLIVVRVNEIGSGNSPAEWAVIYGYR